MFAMPAAGSSPLARYTLNNSACFTEARPAYAIMRGPHLFTWRKHIDTAPAGNARVSPIAKPLPISPRSSNPSP
jgi:hypothetical protein